MNDPFESALRDEASMKTPKSLDARILESARHELSSRRQRGRYFGIAAAAVLLIATGLVWNVLDLGSPLDSPSSPSKPLRIAAAGNGFFEVSKGSLVDDSHLPTHLRLESGRVRTKTGELPLVVDLPVGEFRVRDGDATVELIEEGNPKMNTMKKKLGWGAAALSALALIVWIQIDDGDAELLQDGDERKTIEGNDAQIVPFRRNSNGSWSAISAGTEPKAELSLGQGSGMPKSKVDQDIAPVVAGNLVVEVVDATTLSPIEGARVRVLSWQYQDRVANSMLVEQNARGTWYPLGTGGLDSSETAAPFPWLPDLSSRPLKGQHLVDGLTDTNGLLPAFTFDPKFGDLVVGATGYASLRKSSYKVMSAQVSRIRIELEPAHRISGQILDSNGSQIRFPDFAAVTGYALFPADSKKALSFKMSVNDAGAFEADIGACDLLRIEVHLGGFEPWTKDLAQSDLTHSSVDVHLQRIAFVAGYLVDAKGRAVTQAIVRSSYLGSGRSQVMTSPNAEGFFRISVPKGGIKLEIESEAFAKFETSSPLLNDEEQRITLLPGGRGGISGRILDGGGRPMSGHKVTLHYLSGPLRHDDSTVTNEDGHYQLDDLRVGLYDLACPRSDTKNFRRPDDSKPFEITIARLGIVVRANEVTRDVDLKIGAGGSVSGRVFVKASRISLLDPQDKERVLASRRLGANNSYRFDGIPAGRYALVLGFGDRIELIEIVAGQNLERDLGAAPGRLSAVVARQGQVLANCRVMVAQIIEGQLSAQSLRTDEKGQVEAANLTLGTALLRVQDLDARSAIFTLEVTSTPRQQGLTWPSASVEIDCGDLAITPTATISFYVTTINGIPLAKVAPAAQRRVARVKVDKKIMLIEELNAADYHIVFDNGSETKELNTTLTQNQNTLNL